MQFCKRRAIVEFINLAEVQITTFFWQKTFSLKKIKSSYQSKIIDLVTFNEIKIEKLDSALNKSTFLCVLSRTTDGETKASVYSKNSSKNTECIGSVIRENSPQIFSVNVPIN